MGVRVRLFPQRAGRGITATVAQEASAPAVMPGDRRGQARQRVPKVLGRRHRTGVQCLVMFDFYTSFECMFSSQFHLKTVVLPHCCDPTLVY